MKVLLAGGGTAGHINPAIAIAGYIKEMEPEVNAYLAQISEQAASLQSQVRKRLYEVDRQARDIELQLQAEEAQLYYTIFPNCH